MVPEAGVDLKRQMPALRGGYWKRNAAVREESGAGGNGIRAPGRKRLMGAANFSDRDDEAK